MNYSMKYKVQCKIMEHMFGDDWDSLEATKVHHFLAEALNRSVHMPHFLGFLPKNAETVFNIPMPASRDVIKLAGTEILCKRHHEAYSLIQQHMLLQLLED